MRSSFTAMALALAFVTVTALPAKSFTLNEKPVGGDEVGTALPDVDKAMGVLPTLGTKGPVIPGQNVGMEFGDTDPDDKKPASKGIIIGDKPGGDAASKGIGIGEQPGGDAASKGIPYVGPIIAIDTIPGVGPHDQRPAIPGGIAAKGLSPIISAPGMLPAAKGPPTVLPAGKMPPTVLPAGKGMMIKGK